MLIIAYKQREPQMSNRNPAHLQLRVRPGAYISQLT
jgi:hypothetical protein